MIISPLKPTHPSINNPQHTTHKQNKESLNSSPPRILLLAQNPLFDQLLRLRALLNLMIEAISAHLSVEVTRVGL